MTANGSTEYFQGRVSFFVLGDFLFFLNKNVQHRIFF